MRLLTNAEGDVFIADLGGSMKENSAKSQRPSATNAKRDVLFCSQTPEMVSMTESNTECERASATNTKRDAFPQTPKLVSLRENTTKCKRASSTNAKREVFFSQNPELASMR